MEGSHMLHDKTTF